MAQIQKLNKTFQREQVLASDEMNSITGKIDETVEQVNKNTDAIVKLDEQLNPLNITVTGGKVVEKGTSQTITVSWTLKRGTEVVTADSVTVNGEAASGTSKQFTGVTQTTTYTVAATKDGKTVQGSTTATFVAPMYFGFATAAQASELTITSLVKQAIKTSPNGTYNVTNDTDGKYLWLCVPNTMTINKVTSSGFAVPMEAQQSGSTSVDTYKCYRSSSAINKGTVSIVIS